MLKDIEILVLYFSRHGAVEKLARLAARGVESTGARARVRAVAPIHGDTSTAAPFATLADLQECDGLLLGSPTRFGAMAAPMQAFFESTKIVR